MKKFESFTGGHPLTLDDLEFIESALSEGIKDGIAQALAVDSSARLLYGCEVTQVNPTQRTVSAGWIMWAGNLMRVQAATINGVDPYIVFVPTLLPATGMPQKIYANSFAHDVYLDSFLVPYATASLGNPFVVYHQDLVPMHAGAWRDVGTASNPAFASGWGSLTIGGYRPVGFRKNAGHVVELKGVALTTSTGFALEVFTLPERHRPESVVIFVSTNNFGDLHQVQITPSGTVEVFGISNFSGNNVYLDGIRFEAKIT